MEIQTSTKTTEETKTVSQQKQNSQQHSTLQQTSNVSVKRANSSSPLDMVWSPHHTIQSLARLQPHAVVNLVGSKESTHAELTKIIDLGIKTHIWKDNQNSDNYARPLYRIQSYDLPCECPRPTKKRSQGYQPVGFIKQGFYASFNYSKPAVTIFVFDWRDWAKFHPEDEVFEWRQHEQLVLDQIREHSKSWLKDLSVASKYITIILFPQAGYAGTREVPYKLDECMASLKKAMSMQGEDNIKQTSIHFLSNGLQNLKTTLNKKFVQKVHEQVISYYREKKYCIKRKEKRLIDGQPQHIRYRMKSSIYSLITSNKYDKAISRLDSAYQQLKQLMIGITGKQKDEKRDNADILCIMLLNMHLDAKQVDKFVALFRTHFAIFQRDISIARAELKIDELRWRSNWFYIVGEMLENFYMRQGGFRIDESQKWHTQNSLDTFPGYYFYNCLLQLVARKQEFQRLKNECQAMGRQIYDPMKLENLTKTNSSYIGHSWILKGQEDSATMSIAISNEFDDVMAAYKIYTESQIDLSEFILTQAQKAIGYYKQRSQCLKGPTVQLYQRTIHFINWHISEMICNQSNQGDEYQGSADENNEVYSIATTTNLSKNEKKQQALVTVNERQKLRRQMQTQLIKESWVQQAINLLEKSKQESDSFEQTVQMELQSIMHDKMLRNHKRHSRFLSLIGKVQNQKVEPQDQPLKMTGFILGTSLLWARARFEHSHIQINRFNKMTLEVFSRMSAILKVKKVSIFMSQSSLNQEVDYTDDESLSVHYYSLSKTNPIKIERSFYLDQEDNMIDDIVLNQILIELSPVKRNLIDENYETTEVPHHQLILSLSPFLAPLPQTDEENSENQSQKIGDLLDIGGQNVEKTSETVSKKKSGFLKPLKRLPPPIMYHIDPLPHKLRTIVAHDSEEIKALASTMKQTKKRKERNVVKLQDQALLGDPYDVIIQLEKLEKVNLKSIVATFVGFGSQNIALEESMYSSGVTTVASHNQGGDFDSSQNLQPPQDDSSLMSTINLSMLQSTYTYDGGQPGNSFLGADPRIGVAVLKRSLAEGIKLRFESVSGKRKAVNLGEGEILGKNEDSDAPIIDLAPQEIYYSVQKLATDDGGDQVEELIPIKLGETEENKMTQVKIYDSSEEKEKQNDSDVVDEIDKLKLKMIFYQEGLINNLQVNFKYEFTQNKGIPNEVVHSKSFNQVIKVRSQSPFRVDFSTKTENPFLACIQSFYYQNFGSLDQVRKFLKNSPIIFDQSFASGTLSFKEEVGAIKGDMIAVQKRSFWLVCKLTSQSQHKDIVVRKINLQLNPDVADLLTIVETVPANILQKQRSQKKGMFAESSDSDQNRDESQIEKEKELTLAPGESYEVLFRVEIGQIKGTESLFGDANQVLQPQRKYTKAKKEQETTSSNKSLSKDLKNEEKSAVTIIAEKLQKLKQFYTLNKFDCFSELHFEWNSVEESFNSETNQTKAEELIDLEPVAQISSKSKRDQSILSIPCCVGSPSINILSEPLLVRIRNMDQIRKVRLYQPFTVEYELVNLSPKMLNLTTELKSTQKIVDSKGRKKDYPAWPGFLLSGQIQSSLNLMPNGSNYVIRCNLLPQIAGYMGLPWLSVLENSMDTPIYLVSDFTRKILVTSR